MVIELPTVRQGGKRYPRAHVLRETDRRWAVTTELRPGVFVTRPGADEPASLSFITWATALYTANYDIRQLRRYQETPGVGDPL